MHANKLPGFQNLDLAPAGVVKRRCAPLIGTLIFIGRPVMRNCIARAQLGHRVGAGVINIIARNPGLRFRGNAVRSQNPARRLAIIAVFQLLDVGFVILGLRLGHQPVKNRPVILGLGLGGAAHNRIDQGDAMQAEHSGAVSLDLPALPDLVADVPLRLSSDDFDRQITFESHPRRQQPFNCGLQRRLDLLVLRPVGVGIGIIRRVIQLGRGDGGDIAQLFGGVGRHNDLATRCGIGALHPGLRAHGIFIDQVIGPEDRINRIEQDIRPVIAHGIERHHGRQTVIFAGCQVRQRRGRHDGHVQRFNTQIPGGRRDRAAGDIGLGRAVEFIGRDDTARCRNFLRSVAGRGRAVRTHRAGINRGQRRAFGGRHGHIRRSGHVIAMDVRLCPAFGFVARDHHIERLTLVAAEALDRLHHFGQRRRDDVALVDLLPQRRVIGIKIRTAEVFAVRAFTHVLIIGTSQALIGVVICHQQTIPKGDALNARFRGERIIVQQVFDKPVGNARAQIIHRARAGRHFRCRAELRIVHRADLNRAALRNHGFVGHCVGFIGDIGTRLTGEHVGRQTALRRKGVRLDRRIGC